jgi:heme exporter protein C
MSAIQTSLPITPASAANPDRSGLLKGLTVLAVIGVLIGVYMALVYAGTDVTQGNVQRIFYFHLSSFMGATIGFFVAFGGGIAYLRNRNPKWDTISLAGVEVGLALALITLITGMVWARPTWNTWWTWDPRLTSAAIMALTYAAYLMLRGGLENADKQRTFASIYAILAITTVIATFMITRIRPDTIHPTVIGPSATNAKGAFEMTANIGAAIGTNILVWAFLVTPVLIWWRVRLQNLVERAKQLRFELGE